MDNTLILTFRAGRARHLPARDFGRTARIACRTFRLTGLNAAQGVPTCKPCLARYAADWDAAHADNAARDSQARQDRHVPGCDTCGRRQSHRTHHDGTCAFTPFDNGDVRDFQAGDVVRVNMPGVTHHAVVVEGGTHTVAYKYLHNGRTLDRNGARHAVDGRYLRLVSRGVEHGPEDAAAYADGFQAAMSRARADLDRLSPAMRAELSRVDGDMSTAMTLDPQARTGTVCALADRGLCTPAVAVRGEHGTRYVRLLTHRGMLARLLQVAETVHGVRLPF